MTAEVSTPSRGKSYIFGRSDSKSTTIFDEKPQVAGFSCIAFHIEDRWSGSQALSSSRYAMWEPKAASIPRLRGVAPPSWVFDWRFITLTMGSNKIGGGVAESMRSGRSGQPSPTTMISDGWSICFRMDSKALSSKVVRR